MTLAVERAVKPQHKNSNCKKPKLLISDTAYCKNYEKNAWYYFDDSSVSESDEESTVVGAEMSRNMTKPTK